MYALLSPHASPQPARLVTLAATIRPPLAACSASGGDSVPDTDTGTNRTDEDTPIGLNSAIDAWRSQGVLRFHGEDQSVAGRAFGDEPDEGYDEVVVNGAQFALTVARSAKAAGSRARVAAFGLDEGPAPAVRDGDVQFAVDQQPYPQGCLAGGGLRPYRTDGGVSGGGAAPVLTGPAFATRAVVDPVARFAAAKTR